MNISEYKKMNISEYVKMNYIFIYSDSDYNKMEYMMSMLSEYLNIKR